jgi:hypothetical protein
MPPTPDEVLEPAPQWQWKAPLAWQINCPTCGDSTMDRIAFAAPDHEAVTLHPDRDEYDSPIGTRGGYVRVELVCRDGHHHALILANHKGHEILALIPSNPPA